MSCAVFVQPNFCKFSKKIPTTCRLRNYNFQKVLFAQQKNSSEFESSRFNDNEKYIVHSGYSRLIIESKNSTISTNGGLRKTLKIHTTSLLQVSEYPLGEFFCGLDVMFSSSSANFRRRNQRKR